MLDAVLLLTELAIIKCQAHTNNTDDVSRGNAFADEAAKNAARKPPPRDSTYVHVSPCTPAASLQELQAKAQAEETAQWRKCGCVKREGVWEGPVGKPCLPKWLFPHYADTWKRSCVKRGNDEYYTTTQVACIVVACIICATNNIGRGLQVVQAAHPQPDAPFEHLMMDFVELTTSEDKKYCLVIVDMWVEVEVFPSSKADANAVAIALIIPRWSIPQRIPLMKQSHRLASILVLI